MSFKFVHAADLHLDTPFKGISARTPLASLLHQATFRALTRIVDLCLRERVDFLLLAGDLFDFSDRSIRARLALRQQLARLDQAKIATFIVHGNHDPLGAERGALELPPSVKVFGATWEEAPVVREGQLLCRVQGISYAQEQVCENLTGFFRRTGEEFTIGLLHTNVDDHAAHANYAPCTIEDLSAPSLDYWALGHIHTRCEYPLPSGGVAVFPGNPQGRHVQEAGERGCLLVEVREGRPTWQFKSTDVVRWHALELDVGTLTRWDQLEDAAIREVERCCSEGFDAHVVRISLRGRGLLHRELGRPGALGSLEERLRELLLVREPPVIVESLRDSTRSELDLDDALAAGGLGATIVSAARSASTDPDVLEAILAEAELATLEAALRRVSIRPPEDERALLGRALERAMDLLQDEERVAD